MAIPSMAAWAKACREYDEECKVTGKPTTAEIWARMSGRVPRETKERTPEQIRADALEEAAQECERRSAKLKGAGMISGRWKASGADTCAFHIRKLIGKGCA